MAGKKFEMSDGVKGALARIKSQGAESISEERFNKFGETLNVDLGDVVVSAGDEITFPPTLPDLMSVCTIQVLKNVPPKRDGSQPEAISFCVDCNNGGAKRVYLNSLCASYPEYRYDQTNQQCLATGVTLQSDSTFAKGMRKLSSNLERMKYVLGKTLVCKEVIYGTIANRVGGSIDGVRNKSIPVWEVK
jgi:hypothetical protein